MKTPKPGDIGIVKIDGSLGFFLGFLQMAYSGGSRYLHSFLVLDEEYALETNPKGSRIVPISKYVDRKPVYLDWDLTDSQRSLVVAEAKKFVGVEYSFLEYFFMAFSKFNKCPKWLKNKILSDNKYICSALIACIYSNVGIALFDDQRSYHLVTTGDLAGRYLEKDWT